MKLSYIKTLIAYFHKLFYRNSMIKACLIVYNYSLLYILLILEGHIIYESVLLMRILAALLSNTFQRGWILVK